MEQHWMDSLKAEEFKVIIVTLSDFYIFNTVSLLITSFSGSNKCSQKKENPTVNDLNGKMVNFMLYVFDHN